MAANKPKRWNIEAAFRDAVVLAWHDLVQLDKAHAIYVKYICEPEKPIQRVRVWGEKEGGYEDLICDCWTRASTGHPGGTKFESGWGSSILAQALDFIVEHQNLFTGPTDPGPHRLVRVEEPDDEDRVKALEWFKSVESLEIEQLAKAAEGKPGK